MARGRYEDVPAGAHPFVETATDGLSTLGLDVDTASSTVVRRILVDGQLPPPEAIRVEELLSYFSDDDPPPAQGDFALRAEGAASIFTQEPRTYLLRFNIRARETIAEDAKVQVELHPAAVARWRLIGYGAGHGVTALYEVQLTPQAAGKIASLHLRYRVPGTDRLQETIHDLRTSELVPDWKDASPGFRLASLVVEFAETLRGTSYAGDLHEIESRARRVVEEMKGQPRAAEFVRLVETAARLEEQKP